MDNTSAFTDVIENFGGNDPLTIPESLFEREDTDNEFGSDSDFIPEIQEEEEKEKEQKEKPTKKRKRKEMSSDTESEGEQKHSTQKRKRKRKKKKETKKENQHKKGKKRQRSHGKKKSTTKRRRLENRYQLEPNEHRCCCRGDCSVWTERIPTDWSRFEEDPLE